MDISFGEIVLICLIAFLVLGPKELVVRATQLGRWMRKLRTEINNFKIMAQEEILKDDHFKAMEIKNIEFRDIEIKTKDSDKSLKTDHDPTS